ncbi:MAG: hypothetical protein K1000chlam2_00990 [Chlamydiae bacterium]|nr:hypothetical protein [Chlamydiota bacterium]
MVTSVTPSIGSHLNLQDRPIFDDLLIEIQSCTEKTPLRKISQTLSHLHASIPNLDQEEMRKLLICLPEALRHASSLKKEQAILSSTLGNWNLERSVKGALHYFAIALNIEETQERHEQASSIFVRWTLEKAIHKRLLQHAYRMAAPEKFDAILDDIQRLKPFCSEQKDFDALIKQATQVLTEDPKESRLQLFKPCIQKLRSIDHMLSQTECTTQKYRAALVNYRKKFETSDPSEMLDHFKQLFEVFLEDAFLLVGPPPCDYDLRALGSLAKKSPCPHSDLEWFILIQDKKNLPYFQNLAEMIELQFISLGETAPGVNIPVFTAHGPKHRSGLHIDPGANPALGSNTVELISEPEELASDISVNNINNNDDLATSFLQSVSLKTTNSSLHVSFQAKIDPEVRKKKAVEAIQALKALYSQTWTADPEQLQEFNIKAEFITFLNFLISDFGLYFGMTVISPDAILQKLNRMCILHDIKLIKQVLKEFYAMRIQLHLQSGEQKDSISIASLMLDKRLFLCMAYRFILKPLYNCIDKVLDGHAINLFAEALQCNATQDLEPLMKSFVQAVHKTGLSSEKYYDYFIQIKDSSLRRLYLEELEAQDVDITTLAQIPARDGFRYAQVRDTHALQQALKEITTQNPSDVQVTSSSLGKTYLKPPIAGQILDSNGNIRRQYSDCSHPVASLALPQLHFKQKPNHPLLEYAIHTLTYRVMGRATPPTELARFEVNGRVYPVLISRTILGSSLKTASFSNIDSAHLTWMLLCAILTRPGDGRSSNYIKDSDGKILCIDNDVSLVEPIVKEKLSEQVKFCSILFCLSQAPLDPKILQQFICLDSESILSAWVEDLTLKEQEYARLFSDLERKKLYEEDSQNRFTSSLLLREGVISTLCLQFIHLQQFLKSRQGKISAPELLEAIITLRNDTSKSLIGARIAKQYTQSFAQSTLEKRLEKAMQKTISQSMTTPEVMRATLGKVPTTEEIEKRQFYSLAKAKEELLMCVVQRYLNTENTTLLQKGNKRSLHAHFDTIASNGVPDLSRQELVLKGLTLLVELGHFPDPEEITLSSCSVLTEKKLRSFLTTSIRYLDLRSCPKLTSAAVEKIAKRCPNIEELYLSGSGIDAVGGKGIVPQKHLEMPKLQILHAARCEKLETIKLNAPELQELKVDKCPKLKRTDIGTALLHAKLNLENSSLATLESLEIENKLKKTSKKMHEVLLKILLNNQTPGCKTNSVFYQLLRKQLSQNDIDKILDNNQPSGILDLSETQLDSPDEILTLTSFLKNNQTLRELNLSNPYGANWAIRDEGMTTIANYLKTNQSLQKFDISCNWEGIEEIVSSLETHPTLKVLNISNCYISTRQPEQLAVFLEKNRALQKLYIRNYISPFVHASHASSTGITGFGAKAIASSLEKNQSLQVLVLCGNKIRTEGAKAFAASLEKNQTLRKLNLINTDIGAEGEIALNQLKAKKPNLKIRF